MSDDQRVQTVSKTLVDAPLSDEPTLQQRLGQAATEFSEGLAEWLGDDLRVTVRQLSRCAYGEFVLSEETSAHFCSLITTPDTSRLLLRWSPRLLGLVLDRMLGAAARPGTVARLPLTEIESRLIENVVDHFTLALENAWRDELPFHTIVEQTATSVGEFRLMPVDAETILVEFQWELGGALAELKLLMAADWPARLAAVQAAISGKGGLAKSPGAESTAVELVARLAETEMTAQDLADLSVGDIITTEKDVGEPLDLTIDGAVRFRADLGRVNDKKAVRIVEDVKQDAARRDES